MHVSKLDHKTNVNSQNSKIHFLQILGKPNCRQGTHRKKKNYVKRSPSTNSTENQYFFFSFYLNGHNLFVSNASGKEYCVITDQSISISDKKNCFYYFLRVFSRIFQLVKNKTVLLAIRFFLFSIVGTKFVSLLFVSYRFLSN